MYLLLRLDEVSDSPVHRTTYVSYKIFRLTLLFGVIKKLIERSMQLQLFLSEKIDYRLIEKVELHWPFL